jgi:CRP/FNR family transcriptional regulator
MLSEATARRTPANCNDTVLQLSLGSIFSDRPVEKFAAGNALFWEGDPANHVFEVVEGVLRIFRIIGDGRRAITGFLYPGDLLGVAMRDKYLYSAEAVNAVKIRRFSSSSFQEAINLSPELRPKFFAKMCDEMAGAQEQMVMLSRKTAEERICTFLLMLACKGSASGEPSTSVDVPMTRLDMADYLGLTIETVSRTFTSLIGRGIVSQRGRHNISLKKLSTLARLAGNGEMVEPMAAMARDAQQLAWPA